MKATATETPITKTKETAITTTSKTTNLYVNNKDSIIKQV